MKKKLATVWLAGCSGCHMSLLDIDERLLDLLQLADIVKSPVVDGKDLPEVDVAVVEGAVASDEHLAEIRHIREKAKVLVALGDCAVTGNVSALRNLVSKEAALERAYAENESNDSGCIPDDPAIQKLIDRVYSLNEIVKVDYFIPGCPPDADAIFYTLNELVNGRTPDLHAAEKIKYG